MIPECDGAHLVRGVPGSYQCQDCGILVPTCLECDAPVDDGGEVCQPCVSRWQRVVVEIRSLTESLDALDDDPDAVGGVRGVSYTGVRVTSSPNHDRLPGDLDARHDDVGIRSTASARALLDSWAEAWAEARGDRRPTDSATSLIGSTFWAITHRDASAWHDYAAEMLRCRAALRRQYGRSSELTGVPCHHCGGGRVITPVSDDGLDTDRRTCLDCEASMTTAEAAAIHRAALVAAPHVVPDAILTMRQIYKCFPGISPHTLRARASDGTLAAVGQDPAGRALYRLGDVAAWAATRREAVAA